MLTPDPNRTVYSVSDLNRDVKTLLNQAFPLMWIQGEISNLTIPSSGHWYFTLKDSKAQIRGAMFKQRNRHLKLAPKNGMEVMVRAKVSLYEPRGDYQLIVEDMEEAGAGALQREFEALKNRLQAEGLFDPARKLSFPAQPKRIGIITSPTGAAIRDILSVLERRAAHIPVVIYPVPVQGEDAGNKIASMIAKASRRKDCDVLILTRGGGSLEDLWSFNEEIVARAISESEIPIICGVGHEIDFTIADFVADRRAPTPSAAAELIAPDRLEQNRQIAALKNRLFSTTQNHIKQMQQRVEWLSKRIVHPSQILQDRAQRLDELEGRLNNGLQRHFKQKHLQLQAISARVQQHNPRLQIARITDRHHSLQQRLVNSMKQFLHSQNTELGKLAHSLHTVSPLATLERGYAIVTNVEDNTLIQDTTRLQIGDRIQARLKQGKLIAKVESKE
ncbi:MAG: exodeoxyribonuclease VII large subunit [Gammaproteobacteria bacterium]|nr:exodeoxyribonuclease VII large subunit [Gammaproteobacteria bacterium]